MTSPRSAFAPGRVNLIGDHTDYTGGLAFPIAIELGTTATFIADDSGELTISSSALAETTLLSSGEVFQAGSMGAMLRGLVDLIGTRSGHLHLDTTLPLGSGLSSSASLLIATAMAFGVKLSPIDLARLAQEAEQRAGQSVGLLDQLAIIEGVEGHGLLIDFSNLSVRTHLLDPRGGLLVVHSGVERSLASGAYQERRDECEAAEQMLGPLRDASLVDVECLADPVIARRTRHVISENSRVLHFVEACERGDLAVMGSLMTQSHWSLSTDFAVSTPEIDDLVRSLLTMPGVYGARMTGGGFGGCVVALIDPGSVAPSSFSRAWEVRASGGARLISAVGDA